MLTNRFFFHVGLHHFSTGCEVTKPFYLSVEYGYDLSGTFIQVLNVEMSFKAIGPLKLSNNLAIEIQQAARQNLAKTFTKDTDDIRDIFDGLPENDTDIENELKKHGHE